MAERTQTTLGTPGKFILNSRARHRISARFRVMQTFAPTWFRRASKEVVSSFVIDLQN